MTNYNNEVLVVGTLKNLTLSHETYGEKFYSAFIESMRISGTYDLVPVLVSERFITDEMKAGNARVRVYGDFRSRNIENNGNRKLVLNLFANEIEVVDFEDDENKITLVGFICKKPVYRETPKGRKIGELLIACHRQYGKSDYIPCICWGRNAIFAGGMETGTKVSLTGRIQSREYRKVLEDGSVEIRVAYEVSIKTIEEAQEEE